MLDFKISKTTSVIAAAAAILTAVPSMAGTIEWNGFGSAYYSQALTDDLRPTGYENNYADFATFSKFGLNVSSQLTDQLSAAAQFVAQSDTSTEAWGLVTKWGYLSYRPMNGLNFKVGRQLYPAFIGSEFESVGFLLPYSRIPLAVTDLAPFSGFDGASGIWEMPVGSNSVRIGLFGGAANLSVPGLPTSAISGGVYNVLGLSADWNGEGYTVHASAAHTETDATLTLGAPIGTVSLDSTSTTYTAGFRWDRANVVVWTEAAWQMNNDDDATILKSASGYYGLVGYRIGDFLPRYMISGIKRNTGLGAESDQMNHTIGLNYQASAQAVVKLEYEMMKVADGATPGMATRTTGSTVDSGDSVVLGVDFIF